MDIAARAIKSFLEKIERPNQLSLALKRFRGKYGAGGDKVDYYFETVIPFKVSVYEYGVELLMPFAQSYHKFRDVYLLDHNTSLFSKEEKIYADINLKDVGSAPARKLELFAFGAHHYKQCNPHNPEYWLTVNRKGDVSILPMDYDRMLEMLANWTAHYNSLEKFLSLHLNEFVFHKKTARQLQQVLKSLGINTKVIKFDKFPNANYLTC